MNNLHIYEASPFLGDGGQSWKKDRVYLPSSRSPVTPAFHRLALQTISFLSTTVVLHAAFIPPQDSAQGGSAHVPGPLCVAFTGLALFPRVSGTGPEHGCSRRRSRVEAGCGSSKRGTQGCRKDEGLFSTAPRNLLSDYTSSWFTSLFLRTHLPGVLRAFQRLSILHP